MRERLRWFACAVPLTTLNTAVAKDYILAVGEADPATVRIKGALFALLVLWVVASVPILSFYVCRDVRQTILHPRMSLSLEGMKLLSNLRTTGHV
ncbi:hypothetical protein HDF11_003018 [Tunturiibacter psychrotolerans]